MHSAQLRNQACLVILPLFLVALCEKINYVVTAQLFLKPKQLRVHHFIWCPVIENEKVVNVKSFLF